MAVEYVLAFDSEIVDPDHNPPIIGAYRPVDRRLLDQPNLTEQKGRPALDANGRLLPIKPKFGPKTGAKKADPATTTQANKEATK